MKFTCDSCSAQYMISDDKVGPTGVKVRCKKCGHVITVRRAEDAAAAGAAPAAAPAPSGDGLDAELGSAFDSAFGERQAAPAPPPDLDATQAMSPEDAKRIASAPGAAGPATEWYVAIGEAQVGPLPIADVKRKWEQGDVGPDSLVWRPGMGDWSPLSTVAELASVLAPIPRAPPRAAPAPAAAPAPRQPTPAFGTPAPAAAPSNAAPDATWKPAGASALAALASEELQARAPAAEPPKPAPKPAGARSLVEQMNLADQGGVEPTGALPLSIKGVERTDESPIRRRSSVATHQAEVRQKRGAARAIVVTVVVVLVVVAGGGFAAVKFLGVKLPGFAPTAEAPAAPQVAVATPPQPAAPPPGAAPAPPPPAPAPAPAPEAAAPAPAPAPAPAVAAAPAAAPTPPPRAAAKPARAAPPPPARTTVARREESPPPPPPPPRAAAKPRSDSLLDGIDGGGDDALAEALGGGSSGRSVYVPPRPGGAAALPDEVTDGQVTEGIRGKFDQLAGCADAGESGVVVVMRWSISPEGGTRDVKCAAPCGSQPVASCLAPIIKSIRFPRTVNGRAKVEFPFKF